MEFLRASHTSDFLQTQVASACGHTQAGAFFACPTRLTSLAGQLPSARPCRISATWMGSMPARQSPWRAMPSSLAQELRVELAPHRSVVEDLLVMQGRVAGMRVVDRRHTHADLGSCEHLLDDGRSGLIAPPPTHRDTHTHTQGNSPRPFVDLYQQRQREYRHTSCCGGNRHGQSCYFAGRRVRYSSPRRWGGSAPVCVICGSLGHRQESGARVVRNVVSEWALRARRVRATDGDVCDVRRRCGGWEPLPPTGSGPRHSAPVAPALLQLRPRGARSGARAGDLVWGDVARKHANTPLESPISATYASPDLAHTFACDGLRALCRAAGGMA